MTGHIRPKAHPDPHVDATRGYITLVSDALQASGAGLTDVWLDPSHPRDATFLVGLRALVWNETDGFVAGGFVAGAPGVRTVLHEPVALGGGVLPAPSAVPALLASAGAGAPVRLRSYEDGHDGLDDAIARYALD
jgi:hypothetical protein